MHVVHRQHIAEVAKAAPDAVEVQRSANNFGCLVATRRFEPGECVLQLNGRIVSEPTRTSIELAPDRHVEDELGQFVNHSFTPSTAVDRAAARLVALRKLEPGDEITFDYNQNETKMACTFVDKETSVPVLGRGSQEAQH